SCTLVRMVRSGPARLMRFRTWPVAALGLGGLLVVVALTVLVATRRAREIYDRIDQVNDHHRNVDAKLRRLRSDVNWSGIFVRDYLLDTDRERASETRQRLTDFRTNNQATLAELEALAHGQGVEADRFERLPLPPGRLLGSLQPPLH